MNGMTCILCMDNISIEETKLFPMFSSTLRKFIASYLHIIIEKIRVFAISIIKEIYYNIFFASMFFVVFILSFRFLFFYLGGIFYGKRIYCFI